MADAHGQSPTGHAPIDHGPGFQGVDGPGAGEVRSVKVDMGQGPPPVRRQPERPATAGGAGIVIPSVLALLFGGAGAWAYERFLSPSGQTGTPATPNSQGRDADARKDLTGLEGRIKDLSDQYNKLADDYKQLQSRVDSMPKSAPSPDLASIEQKVAQVDQLSQQVEAIGKRVDPLPQKLEQSEHRIAELDQKLDDLRKQETSARVRTPRDRDRQVGLAGGERPSPLTGGERPSPAEGAESKPAPSDTRGESLEPAFESGVSLFQDKKYGEAYAAFRRLLQSQPDDARFWYYGAISYGLTNGDWGRVTQSMAEEGVAREKAGKPAKAAIDSAFAGLTRETGKDWLDFYRRRAQ
jgi:chaperonin cofactor prefoldin